MKLEQGLNVRAGLVMTLKSIGSASRIPRMSLDDECAVAGNERRTDEHPYSVDDDTDLGILQHREPCVNLLAL